MFHVPESARLIDHPTMGSTAADGNNGAFEVPSPEPGWRLALICSDGSADPQVAEWQWEHVSVHAFDGDGRRRRVPTWKEMCYVKRLCWDAEDVVMQLHPRESQYVNLHPHVLHLWRPKLQSIPEPSAILVGPRAGEGLPVTAANALAGANAGRFSCPACRAVLVIGTPTCRACGQKLSWPKAAVLP